MHTPSPFNSREFRDVLGRFATGVTVVTTNGPAGPYGLTANAFSSLSLDPPLVLVCVAQGGQSCECIQRNGVFAVNILSAEQGAISQYFASRDRPRDAAAFCEIAHRTGDSGAALIDGALAYLDCRLAASHDAGDHIIFIGEVLDLGKSAEGIPLLFYQGRYRELKTRTSTPRKRRRRSPRRAARSRP
ncbi:MAG: hypothetical protein DMG07_16745 [Acidobacteria bacterium]|nr:MAG: hypothetical protein DMG07_16745 [Acidobacteriota bacterium]